MPAVQKTASLDEKTVQKVARDEIDIPVIVRARGTGKNSRVKTRTVHPSVWKEALRLAEGNIARIKIINENEVIVH